MTKLIYIAGRGHSGSTILDLCSAKSLGACSCGEIISGLSRCNEGRCTCGNLISECEFWSPIVGKVLERLSMTPNELQHFSRKKFKFWNVFSFFRDIDVERFDHVLLEELGSVCGTDVFIDSSKELSRANQLLNNRMIDCDVIYIWRSGIDVLGSYQSRYEKSKSVRVLRKNIKVPFFFLIGIFVLLAQSFGALWFVFSRLRYGGRINLICYEDIPNLRREQDFKNFGEVLHEIVGVVPLDPRRAIFHPISGNRLVWRDQFEISFAQDRKRSSVWFGWYFLYFVLGWPHILLGLWPRNLFRKHVMLSRLIEVERKNND